MVPSGENVDRLHIPDEKVSWLEPWPSYRPPHFTLPGLSRHPWADPEIGSLGFHPRWNKKDDGVIRESLVRLYDVRNGYPLNPCGRTGLAGRGRLGRWGPNHAVDAVVTRWKMSAENEKILHAESKLPILQFISIQRRDTGEWALPGGMVDRWESTDDAVQREFIEEALNIPKVAEYFETEVGKSLKAFFNKGQIIYKGYVDDPRNTDNAWMETSAYLFHDEDNSVLASLQIQAGDDAAKAQWVNINGELNLYASHSDIIKEAVSMLGADW